ncbi:bublin coiled-coil protein [Linepithema humile]|uniref:bublin coiled-coil protein n=1 Tax=Linepithema humile TaxID=83485 RepID=UPI000623AB57|nr:PREDICTED: UPF0184 protein C9orf16 homolog [Linepithema humile]
MQVARKDMVRDEYPAPEEKEKVEDMDETVQPEENNQENANEEMECVEDEEYSNDISDSFEEDMYSADTGFKALEDQLDHLQTALDHLERKNDDIHAELIELLQSNREARKQFQESLQIEEQQ